MGSWISARASVSRRFMPPERRVYSDVAFARQAKSFEQHVGAVFDRAPVQTEIAGLKDQNVTNRQVAIEIVFLRRKADPAARFAPVHLVVVPKDPDRAPIGLCQADNRVDRRRLARAVGSEKPEKFTRFDAHRNVVDGGEVAVAFDQVLDFDGRSYGTNPLRRL